jgi:hypothetical protein
LINHNISGQQIENSQTILRFETPNPMTVQVVDAAFRRNEKESEIALTGYGCHLRSGE